MNALSLFVPPALMWLAVLTNVQQQTVPIREAGSLESASVIEIQAPFEAAILELTAEGKRVKKGDVLLKLDTSALEDLMQQQIVKVAQLEAQQSFLEAQLSEMKVQLVVEERVKALSDEVIKLEREALTAQDGEFAIQLQHLQIRKQATAKTLKSIQQQLARQTEQGKKGVVSSDEIVQSAAELADAQIELQLIDLEIDLLTKSKPLKLAELELKNAELSLRMTGEMNATREKVAVLAGEREAYVANLKMESARLKSIEGKIASAVVVAPSDGVLFYVQPNSRTFPQDRLEEGSLVRERQAILHVADMSRLQVLIHVNETRINRIKQGQEVTISFDADRRKAYQGIVKEVGSVPLPGSFFRADVKEYPVVVTLPDAGQELRIGMTAIAEFK